MKSKIKITFLLLALSIFTFLYVSPLQAQEVRDHRNKKKDKKVRDHRTETNTTVRDHRTKNTAKNLEDVSDGTSKDIMMGEKIGTITSIKKKYPSIKFTGKVDRIMITDKLHDGDNLVFKMKSGNTLHAIVKEGKIIKYTWKDSQGNQNSGGDGDDVEDVMDISFEDLLNVEITTAGKKADDGDDESAQLTPNSTCFQFTEICYDPDGAGVDDCWTTYLEVDCSKSYNASIPGPVVGKTKQ